MSTRNIIIALVAIAAVAALVYGYRRYKANKANKAPAPAPPVIEDKDRIRPGTPVVEAPASELTKMRYA